MRTHWGNKNLHSNKDLGYTDLKNSQEHSVFSDNGSDTQAIFLCLPVHHQISETAVLQSSACPHGQWILLLRNVLCFHKNLTSMPILLFRWNSFTVRRRKAVDGSIKVTAGATPQHLFLVAQTIQWTVSSPKNKGWLSKCSLSQGPHNISVIPG